RGTRRPRRPSLLARSPRGLGGRVRRVGDRPRPAARLVVCVVRGGDRGRGALGPQPRLPGALLHVRVPLRDRARFRDAPCGHRAAGPRRLGARPGHLHGAGVPRQAGSLSGRRRVRTITPPPVPPVAVASSGARTVSTTEPTSPTIPDGEGAARDV